MPLCLLNTNENLGLYSALAAVKPNFSKSSVEILWQNIIGTCFPSREGHKWDSKSSIPTADYHAIVVLRVRRTGTEMSECIEKQILVVDCMGPVLEGPESWDIAQRAELRELLEYRGCRCHVAMAIGTKVKFYSWDPSTEPRFLPLDNDKPKDLLKMADCGVIEDTLNGIKIIGWD